MQNQRKVASHKTLTISRLELLKRAIEMIVKVDKIYFWTDSEVCLRWIKSVDKEWKA